MKWRRDLEQWAVLIAFAVGFAALGEYLSGARWGSLLGGLLGVAVALPILIARQGGK